MSATPPYKRTPVFDENTLPAGLRKEHRTKPGVWGVIRVLKGRLRYRVLDPVAETTTCPSCSAHQKYLSFHAQNEIGVHAQIHPVTDERADPPQQYRV